MISVTGWYSTAGHCAWPGGRSAGNVPCGTGTFFAPMTYIAVWRWAYGLKQVAAQLHSDPDAVQRMAQSPDGQALLTLIQQQNGAQLQKVMAQGESGSAAEMAGLLKTVLSSSEGRELLQRLSQQLQQ